MSQSQLKQGTSPLPDNLAATIQSVRPSAPRGAEGVPSSAAPVERASEPLSERPRSEPPRPGRLALWCSVVLVVAFAAFFGLRYLVPREVEVTRLIASDFQPVLSGPGVLDATVKANIGSSIQGVITRLNVERNDVVVEGDLIAEIGAADLEAQRDAAFASREAALRAVDAAAAEVTRARATLDNARSNFDRQDELLRSGVVTRSSQEGAETAARQAEADLVRSESALSQARAQEAAASANLAASEALLDKAVIRAPINGVIVARDLNRGDVASPSNVIVTIADPASIVLQARFDESVIARLEPGQAAAIRFGFDDVLTYPGEVRRISREVDQETREFTVDIAPTELPPRWALGQRATVVIDLDRARETLSIPVDGLVRRDGVAGVWLVEQGRAVWRPVELGRTGAGGVEIVGGLSAGDAIIRAPDGIHAWMPVTEREDGP